jgi:hypothetical protein
MRKLIVATIAAAGVAINAHACPIGSFPSVDNWGNQICKGLDTGQTTTKLPDWHAPLGRYLGQQDLPELDWWRSVLRHVGRLSGWDVSVGG